MRPVSRSGQDLHVTRELRDQERLHPKETQTRAHGPPVTPGCHEIKKGFTQRRLRHRHMGHLKSVKQKALFWEIVASRARAWNVQSIKGSKRREVGRKEFWKKVRPKITHHLIYHTRKKESTTQFAPFSFIIPSPHNHFLLFANVDELKGILEKGTFDQGSPQSIEN